MNKKIVRVIALCLTLCMLLTGCMGINIPGYFGMFAYLFGGTQLTPFAEMAYTRPDMEQFHQVLEQCCADAEKETNINKMVDIIYKFYEEYDSFYTNLALAMIYYSKDLTDAYWEAENTFCTENSTQIDAGLDRFYRVLAKSSLRETLEGDDYFGPGFFDSYQGESIYDEVFTALLNQEAALQNEYYLITGEAAAVTYYSEQYFTQYGTRMADVFLELVKVRQQMAEHAGYDSYPEFAYDFYHVRDYSADQATTYLADIRAELVPLYRQLNNSEFWNLQLEGASEQDTFSYVQDMASQMRGVIQEAFTQMEKGHLYDISYGANKYNASFEVFLRNYYTPYIFINPTGTEYDKLTFAHEFGHFCNDYASMGSGAGVDVAEIFSQGMEYLSLFYASDDGDLEKLKMASCLSTYVEQAAYASFEQQVYSLSGDELTVEGIQNLYADICKGFGFDTWAWDSRDYVCITHFFTSPMYVISYVVSNDAALQLYQMEQAQSGAGLACLQANLTTMQPYFLAFVEKAGLKSPFAPDRMTEVRKTLQTILN